MKKRLLCMALCALLCIAQTAWAEGIPESPEVPAQVYFNDELTDIPAVMQNWSRYVHYVPVAALAGYETTYDGATDTVTSVKDDRTISFVPYAEIAIITENGTDEEVYLDTILLDDRTYISYWSIDALFGYSANWDYETSSLYLYDLDMLTERFMERADGLEQFMQIGNIPENFSETDRFSLSFDVDLSEFGVTLSGDLTLDLIVQKQGDAIAGTISADFEGLANLLQLVLHPVTQSDFSAFKEKLDLSQPATVEFYLDSEGAYVKDSPIVEFFLLSSLPYNTPVEGWQDAVYACENKWISFALNDFAAELYQSLMNIPVENTNARMLANNIAILFSESIPSGKLVSTLDAFSGLFASEHVQYVEKDDTTSIELHLTSEDFREVFACFTDDTALLEAMEMSIDTSKKLGADGQASGNGIVQFKLGNFPNTLDIQIGSMEIVFSVTSEVIPGEQTITKPTDVVSFDELYKIADTAVEIEEELFDL